MYQPERFRIAIPETVPTYAFVGPYESPVSYRYPYEYTVSYGRPYEYTVSYGRPYEVVVHRDDRGDVLRSETSAIRRELRQIKNDVGEIKQRQASPTYYMVKEDYPTVVCPTCNTTFYPNEQTQYSQVPMYYCERCRSFVEKPTYSVATRLRSKTPNTTYQDSYRSPPPYSSPYGHLERCITLNELQRQPPPSTAPAQHPRHWIPTAFKNAYPHRRWNLSVPHSEP